MGTAQTFKGPSWGDAALAQGRLVSEFGGFVVVHMGVANQRYNPRILWWRVQWSPSLAHVLHHYSWASADEWPNPRYDTVPAMLIELCRDLGLKLARAEYLRQRMGLGLLRDAPPAGPKEPWTIVT